jgi:hypothetical protein
MIEEIFAWSPRYDPTLLVCPSVIALTIMADKETLEAMATAEEKVDGTSERLQSGQSTRVLPRALNNLLNVGTSDISA